MRPFIGQLNPIVIVVSFDVLAMYNLFSVSFADKTPTNTGEFYCYNTYPLNKQLYVLSSAIYQNGSTFMVS